MDFDDIRPYNNDEAAVVLKRLSKNKYLIDTLLAMYKPGAKGVSKFFWSSIIRVYLIRLFSGVSTIEDFQSRIVGGMLVDYVVTRTTDGLTFEGLSNLKKNDAYIYMSNHRDIVLDVAFINYILARESFSTAEIAFGDNLMKNQFITDLIRINKSFIVKRNLPIREQIQASIQLSAYINQTLENGNSIWIAQREGRAKDGNDETNKAIIKMIHLAKRKSESDFSNYVNRLKIVPVSISYEFDPLDRMKGWELHRKETRGKHEKRKAEDVVSMYSGIKGKKGRIHIVFGTPLSGQFATDKDVADALDREIQQQYKLWPSNYLSYDLLYKTGKYSHFYTDEYKADFLRRYKDLKPELMDKILGIYANAVINKEKHT